MPENKHISLDAALERLSPVSLEEMEAVKLLNRIDSKYLTSESVLLALLSDAAQAGYRALVVDGVKLNRYSSVYFDTVNLKMFSDHHNRRLVRQKVRTRTYVETGQTFLEIKRKNNHGRTKKKRMEIPLSEFLFFGDDPAACDFLSAKSWFTADQLSKVLETRFKRITLVNPAMTERLTIDTSLEFANYRTGFETSLQNAVIIELKQDGRADSQMKRILLSHRIKPVRVSKYCIAVTMTDPSARRGRFKTKLRTIEKTIGNKLITI